MRPSVRVWAIPTAACSKLERYRYRPVSPGGRGAAGRRAWRACLGDVLDRAMVRARLSISPDDGDILRPRARVPQAAPLPEPGAALLRGERLREVIALDFVAGVRSEERELRL